ncbi:hypothetical protein J2X16_004244 [Pelomonas aquatica]|uniref:Lysozyme inhibitor LprI N-terminal domain-containing protein n=1 Tax=Pelomonas aquatica TaxID=431058 RepID=A0ABU1ZFS6_9BURK|nr:hypothetical protein [Pelomonas aquatica]MDR7298876.1 hypothetical protein [Pelomonas aquatica]
MRRIIVSALLALTLSANADGIRVTKTFDRVVALARAEPTKCEQPAKLIPSTFSSSDYELLILKIQLSGLGLKEFSDGGRTCLEGAMDHSIYRLASLPDGGKTLIRLLENSSFLWDGARSLTLCDAMVRRGNPMALLLEKVTSKNRHWALRCSEKIRNGYKTAF